MFDSVIISKTDNLANCHNEIGSTATTQSTHLVFRKQKKMLS